MMKNVEMVKNQSFGGLKRSLVGRMSERWSIEMV